MKLLGKHLVVAAYIAYLVAGVTVVSFADEWNFKCTGHHIPGSPITKVVASALFGLPLVAAAAFLGMVYPGDTCENSSGPKG